MHPLVPWFEPPAWSIPFPLHPITIHAFGVLVMIGFWLGGDLAARKAVRFTDDPDAAGRIEGLILLLIAGTLVGGHVGEVLIDRPHLLAGDPFLLLRFWDGLSSIGGFAVCVPTSVLYFTTRRVSPWPYLDALAFGFTLGWFFGRLGCFTAHDHPGVQTTFWLGVQGACPGHDPMLACHDLGLYEAIASLATFATFVVLDRRPRLHGLYVGLLATSYGPTRFLMDFFRQPSEPRIGTLALTAAQYGCVLITALGVWILCGRTTRSIDSPGGALANVADPQP